MQLNNAEIHTVSSLRCEPGAESVAANTGSLQPRMHGFTLRFHDQALERDYADAMLGQTLLVVRFGIVLAMGLCLLFGLLDPWVPKAQLAFIWQVRGTVLLIATGLLALTFTASFGRHRHVILALFILSLGVGLASILAVVPDQVANQYYVGYLLLIIGAFTVPGLRFPDAAGVSLLLVGMYVATELLLRREAGLQTLMSSVFLLATLLAAGLGGYISERQRRLAHCRRRLVEKAREDNRRDALHDPLTGLPNRRLFMERLSHAVAHDERRRAHAAVLFIDLDSFKPVNDTHGHVFGDKLLKAVANRLLERVRLTDTVARLGGDEFTMLLEDLPDAHSAIVLRERVLERFDAPFMIDGIRMKVNLSIGMALHPVDANGPRELLEAADKDMYRVKQVKRGVRPARPDC